MSSGLSIPSPGSSAAGRRGGRARRRKKPAFGLQLTSLMDVLIIIVIFLLKSYGLSSMSVAQEDKIELPVSKSADTFGEGIVLVVAQDKILLDGTEILKFNGNFEEKKFEVPDEAIDRGSPGLILPVLDALKKKKEEFDNLASREPDPAAAAKKWTGDLLVQADKSASYALIRQIMYTAGMAGYKQFRLTVEKQGE